MQLEKIEEIFLKHSKRLRQYCLRYLTNYNPDDADDLVQQSFTNFIDCQQKEEAKPVADEKIASYLRTTARRVFFKQLGDKNIQKNAEPLDEGQPPDELIDKTSLTDRIEREQSWRETLRDLSELERKVIWLSYVEDLKQEDIAKACNISVSYVKQLVAKAKRKLRLKKPPLE